MPHLFVLLLIFLSLLTTPSPSSSADALPRASITITPDKNGRIVASRHVGEVFGTRSDDQERTVISVGQDRTVRLWSLADAVQERVIEMPQEFKALDAVLSDDGEVLAVAAYDAVNLLEESLNYPIFLYQRHSGSYLTGIPFHESFVNRLSFSGHGRYLLSSDNRGGVVLWQLEHSDGKLTYQSLYQVKSQIRRINGPRSESLEDPFFRDPQAIIAARLIPSDKIPQLVTLDRSGTLALFDPLTPKRRKTIKVPEQAHFDVSARNIAVLTPDGRVRLYDLNFKETFRSPPDQPVFDGVSLSVNGRWLALQRKDNKGIVLFDFANGGSRLMALPESSAALRLNEIGFTGPNSLFARTPQGLVSWNILTRQSTPTLRLAVPPLSDLQLRGETIYLRQGERRVSLAAQSLKLSAAEPPAGALTPPASYRGATLRTCSDSQDFCLQRGSEPERPVETGFRSPNAALLTSDGLLLTGTDAGGLFADTVSQTRLDGVPHAHDGAITEIASDGNLVATLASDNTVKLWQIDELRACAEDFAQTFTLSPPLPDTPAERAGIREDDLLLGVDDVRFRDGLAFLDHVKPTGSYRLNIERNGQPLTITVAKDGPLLGLPFRPSAQRKNACDTTTIQPLGSAFLDDDGRWLVWREGQERP